MFHSCDREEYDILNASNVLPFYALDKKSEAGKSEIEANFSGVEKYIQGNKNLERIILFEKS